MISTHDQLNYLVNKVWSDVSVPSPKQSMNVLIVCPAAIVNQKMTPTNMFAHKPMLASWLIKQMNLLSS